MKKMKNFFDIATKKKETVRGFMSILVVMFKKKLFLNC